MIINRVNEEGERITISDEEINKLPVEVFNGKIVVIEKLGDVQLACDRLLKAKLIGIDTESKPSFRKGIESQLSLIQLALDDVCFLFRINKLRGIPSALSQVLNAKTLTLIGLSLKDDFSKIRSKANLNTENYIELQEMVKEFDIEEQSLKKLYAVLFDKKISKKQRLSNWNKSTLTSAQKMYAAIDAWACLKIYNKLNELKANKN